MDQISSFLFEKIKKQHSSHTYCLEVETCVNNKKLRNEQNFNANHISSLKGVANLYNILVSMVLRNNFGFAQ